MMWWVNKLFFFGRKALLPCFVLMVTNAAGQMETLDTVNIAAVEDTIWTTPYGAFLKSQSSKIIALDDEKDLGQSLARYSSTFIKTYGVNALSTLSIRGASAAQNSILWEGIPIQNTGTGVTDLSLISSSLFSSAKLQYGGSGALLGSANIGGSVFLSNNRILRNQTEVFLQNGSFAAWAAGAHLKRRYNKGGIYVNAHAQTLRNNFLFQDNSGAKIRMTNAQAKSLSITTGIVLQQQIVAKSKPAELKADLWLQQYERAIPPALFEHSSVKQQQDKAFRAALSVLQPLNHGQELKFLAGATQDKLHYQDAAVLLNNAYRTRQLSATVFYQKKIESNQKLKQLINISIPVTYTQLQQENFDTTHQQQRSAIVAAYHLEHNRRYGLDLALRQEFVAGKSLPVMPGIAAFADFFSKLYYTKSLRLRATASLQRSYRLPTLNELYFFPGGNTQLLPEQGYSAEIGLETRHTRDFGNNKYLNVTSELTYFNRRLKNWIYWLGGSIFTPHNISEVHSTGLDVNLKLSYATENWTFSSATDFALTHAITTQSYIAGDASIGKQLPYTPLYTYRQQVGIAYKSVSADAFVAYDGYRFINLDESALLPAYTVYGLQFRYLYPVGKTKLSLQLNMDNLSNNNYQVIAARPLPGFHYSLGFAISWQ